MQLRAPQQRFLHDMFTIESNGKNNMGADTSARHCMYRFQPYQMASVVLIVISRVYCLSFGLTRAFGLFWLE